MKTLEFFEELRQLGFSPAENQDSGVWSFFKEITEGIFDVWYSNQIDNWGFKEDYKVYFISGPRKGFEEVEFSGSPEEILNWIRNFNPKKKTKKRSFVCFVLEHPSDFIVSEELNSLI